MAKGGERQGLAKIYDAAYSLPTSSFPSSSLPFICKHQQKEFISVKYSPGLRHGNRFEVTVEADDS
jgi:hypothetical protein